MTQVKAQNGEPLRMMIRPGETIQLPGGRGSITLESVPRWAGLSVRSDPGKLLALIGATLGLIGLVMSMVLRRRRIFVRVTPDGEGTNRVQVGALAKGDDPRLQLAVDELMQTLRSGSTDATYPEQVKKAGAR